VPNIVILQMHSKTFYRFVGNDREESPDNNGHHTSEREDIREGIVAEKKITVPLLAG